MGSCEVAQVQEQCGEGLGVGALCTLQLGCNFTPVGLDCLVRTTCMQGCIMYPPAAFASHQGGSSHPF